jgi:two-component system phosphate regulon sensor histidine kinase PhoR
MPLQERVSAETQEAHKKELEVSGVKTKFEFVIFNNGVTTKIKSGDFKYNKENLFNSSFTDNEGNENEKKLLVTFPHKKKFLLSELASITILSIIFTLIIIVAYSSALIN